MAARTRMAMQSQRGGIFVKLLLTLFILGVIASAVVGYIAWQAYKEVTEPGPLAAEAVILIERGDSVAEVGDKLVALKAIGDDRLFEIVARIDELAPSLRAGEFVIPPRTSTRDIIAILRDGDPMLRFVTVPEGLTTNQVLARLSEVELLTGKVTNIPKEGDILPETYSYQRGESRQAVLERMVEAHDEVLEKLWLQRADNLPIETPEEAVILASIVEKETGVADERPRVAAVFVNRLRRNMRLQSDPTVIYGLTGGEPLGRGLRRSELDRTTPYNTYRINGLPPTPIANPGEASIAAVLNPLETDEYYFVADGTGGHAFAKTLAEHNRNVARWRQIERERQEAAQ